MRRALLALLLAALPGGSPAREAPAGDPAELRSQRLEDGVWRSRYRRLRGWIPLWKGDELRFDDGRFQSADAQAYGFGPAPYTLRRVLGVWVWNARQSNPDGEVLRWRGAWIGGRMTGAFRWDRPDGTRRRFRFSAELSGRPAPGRPGRPRAPGTRRGRG